MSPQTRNALGLAAMHLAVTTSLNPPEVFEEAQVTSQRVRRWLMMLALMRHYGLNAAELATLLDMSQKRVHRVLRAVRRLQQTDPRVAAVIRTLDSSRTVADRAA